MNVNFWIVQAAIAILLNTGEVSELNYPLSEKHHLGEAIESMNSLKKLYIYSSDGEQFILYINGQKINETRASAVNATFKRKGKIPFVKVILENFDGELVILEQKLISYYTLKTRTYIIKKENGQYIIKPKLI